MEPHIRDVRPPDLLHPRDGSPASHVWGHPLGRRRLAHPWFGLDRLAPHRLPQSRHAFVIHVVAVAAPPGSHPSDAIGRRVRVRLIQ